ncbi:MAG: TIGR02281 family clan AA aspartic protease [Paracoccaceae bacterium]|nr:TIGR02281 family clan AA aspartic protease [Paracoccaceae bacterium]
MESLDIENIIYLVVLLAFVGGWFLAEFRGGMGKAVRMAAAWALIFFAAIAAFGMWDDVRRDLIPRQAVIEDGALIEVPRQPDGHFHLVLEVNETPVEFLVDTGATDIVFTVEDARRAGLDPDSLTFFGRARTANGDVATAFTRVDTIALGPIVHENVSVTVNSGEMPGSLLGMSYLSRFERLEISGNQLTLVP